jgi:hypothetical protein
LKSHTTPVHEVVEGAVQTTGGADGLHDVFHPGGRAPPYLGSAIANAHIATSSGFVEKEASGRVTIIIVATTREREEKVEELI